MNYKELYIKEKQYKNSKDILNKLTDYKECLKKIQNELDTSAKQKELEDMLSRKDIYDISKNWSNKQESAIVALLFEGICGKTFSEIKTLQSKDIDDNNNVITLQNRSLFIPKELIDILKIANNETVLYKDKGNIKYSYIPSNYLFKITNVGDTIETNSTGYAIEKQTISRRLNYIGNNIGFTLKSNNIKKSGICYYMSLFEGIEHVEPSLQTIAKILNRFDIRANIKNCYDFKNLYSFYKLSNKYQKIKINEDSIKIYNEINSYVVDTKFLYDKKEDNDLSSERNFFINHKANEKLGLNGETFIESYLKVNNCFDFEIQNIENVTKNYCGYDFKIVTTDYSQKKLEIKSTENNYNNIIYLTRKELEVSYKSGDNYYLCIIYFEKEVPVNFYIIKNPIKHFRLEKAIDSLINVKNDDLCLCEIWPVQYMIKLDKSILEEARYIEL